jgi:hypothetical protein
VKLSRGGANERPLAEGGLRGRGGFAVAKPDGAGRGEAYKFDWSQEVVLLRSAGTVRVAMFGSATAHAVRAGQSARDAREGLRRSRPGFRFLLRRAEPQEGTRPTLTISRDSDPGSGREQRAKA